MAFIFKLTAAGRNSLINAAHTGTAARTVVSVGITSTAILSGHPIADEIKRIATISGEIVAEDTIHVTIRDDSDDAYVVRGYGLYLENGVLLGSYGQADPIINKTSASIMLLSTDARILDGSADISTLIFGDSTFSNPAATTERKGVVELATPAETAAGLSDQLAVTPAGLQSAMGNRFPFFTAAEPLPATNIGPIWHEAFQSIMTWRVFNANGANYTGYASVDIGLLRPDSQPVTRDAWVKIGITGLPTSLALYHWAKHYGLMKTADWSAGTLFYKDFGNGTFGTPDVRGEHPRFWDDLRNIIPGQAFGSWLQDAFQHHSHGFKNGSREGDASDVTTNGNGHEWEIYTPWVGEVAGWGAPRIATETRGRSTAFAGVIHI